MNLTPEQVRWIFIYLFVLIVSVAVHEFGHAMMADRLGDSTPRRQGRVTLNPIAHMDLIGTLLLPLTASIYGAASGRLGGFGWGKPVQWQPRNVRRGIRLGTASILVALAGPSMNVMLGTLCAIVHTILVKQQVIAVDGEATKIFLFAVTTNFILFFFNLLPVPPLDGGHVAEELMPRRYQKQFETYARFGPFVVLAVAMIPQVAQIFVRPAYFCTESLYSLLGKLFG